MEGSTQNVVTDAEQFLLQKVQFNLIDYVTEDLVEEEKYLRVLESVANGGMTMQELHAFSIDPRERINSCKAVLTYILTLRNKATVLLQQLKL